MPGSTQEEIARPPAPGMRGFPTGTPRARDVAAGIAQGLFYLAYPLVIYLAHTRLETRSVGGILLGLYGIGVVLRMRGAAEELWPLLRQHLPLVALILAAVALGNRSLLLMLPMLVSAYLFATFAWSLVEGPPMIERFARMVEDDLPEFTLSYCRKVTMLWCGLLAANSVAVVALALAAPIEWWALYTGALFYVLLGAFLACEFVFRKLWFRYYTGGIADRILERAFPAERSANGRRSLAYVEARESAIRSARAAGTPGTC